MKWNAVYRFTVHTTNIGLWVAISAREPQSLKKYFESRMFENSEFFLFPEYDMDLS